MTNLHYGPAVRNRYLGRCVILLTDGRKLGQPIRVWVGNNHQKQAESLEQGAMFESAEDALESWEREKLIHFTHYVPTVIQL